MIAKKLVLAGLFAMLACMATPALAKTVSGSQSSSSEPAPANGVRLAQAREVDVYYDDYGRRVVVDAHTGQVIDVLPPRRRPHAGYGRGIVQGDVERYDRDRPFARDDERGEDDGFYRDEPDDLAPLHPRGGVIERPAPPPQMSRQGEAPRFEETQPGVYEQAPATKPRTEPNADLGEGDNGVKPPSRLATREAPLDESTDGQQRPIDRLQPPAATPPVSREPFVDSAPALGPIISTEAVAQLQILLDRAGASPGVIDGKFGENVRNALVSYKEITGRTLNTGDAQAIKAALDASGGPAFTSYTITNEDAAGPYVASVPADYSAKAKLDKLGYSSVAEMLAERFHMDEDYLKKLNPSANFSRPGTVLRVASVGAPVKGPVARIVANKKLGEVLAYDGDGKLIASYPSTIGSTDTPSPSGTVKVERVAFNPTYTYNPKINFKQGHNDKVLTIPPGPNGPVGSVWIALSKPTYGIHGTPEPSKIGKTNSHGCVRLTNWDAQELAKMVSPGVWVQFVD